MAEDIYLDYQATTPVAPEVAAAMQPWLADHFGNPHSPHKAGRMAAAAVEAARENVLALLPPGGRLIFTSGATEALNLAIKGALANAGPRRRRIITLATEHAAVLDSCRTMEGKGYALTILPVRADGLVDIGAAQAQMSDDAALLVVMQVNNEIGVIQPVRALAELAHQAGALFLCDAVQSFGRMAVPDNADMIALSAHKIHGPKGIGALWLKDGISLYSQMHGGAQEAGLRSGTLSPMLCAGLGAAAELAKAQMAADAAHVAALWECARALLPDWQTNGALPPHRYAGNLNIRREGVDAARLIADVRMVMFSAGSACASGSGRTSHVLGALGLSSSSAKASIRLGFGRYTRMQDIEDAARLLNESAVKQL